MVSSTTKGLALVSSCSACSAKDSWAENIATLKADILNTFFTILLCMMAAP
ncbi:hypothetical protein ACFBZI_10170 [Moraxella sp. ZJ142]|uniref:hypothetical protein n=1 Tax=Moraxella marmotae TaxID=3344520 RepID=UPI0035D4AF9B